MGLVRLAHLADLDLGSIRDYIGQHNPTAANRVLDEIFDTLERLADAPELGERRSDLAQNLRAFAVRLYVIFYYPSPNGIHVARIVHGARDFPTMFG